MALPSAQLGQLSNINVPSHVPVQAVAKQPKLWQQVLMQALAQGLSGAVGQGVENAMSRDYADPALGEKKATGFDKLFHGATVNEKENTRRQTERARKEEHTREIIARGNERRGADTEATYRQAKNVEADVTRAEMDNARLMAELQHRSQELAQRERHAGADIRRDRLLKQIDVERDLIKAVNEQPLQNAQVDRLRAETRGAELGNQLSEKWLSAPQVDPKTGKPIPPPPRPETPDPKLQAVMQVLQQRIADGTVPPQVAQLALKPGPGQEAILQAILSRIEKGNVGITPAQQ